MFGRDNLIGTLLLLCCGVVAVILIVSIVTGDQLTLNIPRPVGWVLGIFFIGALIYGFTQGSLFRRLRGGQSGPQWPNPDTGQKSLWDRIRGK